MEARRPKSREAVFSEWEDLSDISDTEAEFSDFNLHANTYPESDECPFLPLQVDYRIISPDREIPEWTYFYARSPGLQANVPIPLHPGLTQTVFYTHLSYLLLVCRPFSHTEGLDALNESNLDASYLARGPLVPRIRRALGRGRSVVVRECSTRFDGIPIEVEDERFSQLVKTPNAEIDAQDLVRWPNTIKIDLARFWKLRTNQKCILNLLDLNCHLHAGRPTWMGGLYDDPAARRTVSATSSYTIADLIRYPQWQLFGHPFSFTPTHHDSTGVSTYITVVRGRKLWFLLQWTVPIVTPRMWLHRLQLLSRGEVLSLEYSVRPPWDLGADAKVDKVAFDRDHANWEKYRIARWECVELEAGMTLVMPPGQLHWVYKPETSFAIGGHGLLWEALPWSEVSSRMDCLCDTLSNDVHGSMPLVHAALALQLPTNPLDALRSGRTEEELRSLCRLVLASSHYRRARGEEDAKDKRYNRLNVADLETKAKQIVRVYRKYFSLEVPQGPSRPLEVSETELEWATISTGI